MKADDDNFTVDLEHYILIQDLKELQMSLEDEAKDQSILSDEAYAKACENTAIELNRILKEHRYA